MGQISVRVECNNADCQYEGTAAVIAKDQEWVQLTGGILRVSPDGDAIAWQPEGTDEWQATGLDHHWTDIIIHAA